VWRQHNAVADMGTPFNAIPYPFSPQFGENESRGRARATRLSLLVEGVLTPTLKDNADWGFHFLGGQAWRLLTQNTIGITPRKENIPLTIEANYVAGFDYTRNWQLRVVQDWGTWASFGVSVEAPAELVYAGARRSPQWRDRQPDDRQLHRSRQLVPGQRCLCDQLHDRRRARHHRKGGFRSGLGHYEVFGLARFFNDGIFHCMAAGLAPTGVCYTSTAADKSRGRRASTPPGQQGRRLGAPAGSSEVPGSSGLGHVRPRYRPLRCVEPVRRGHRPDGTLAPLTAWHALVGGVLHPWAGLDIYAYAGLERTNDKLFNVNPASSGALGGVVG
jgi:hypothetical protein